MLFQCEFALGGEENGVSSVVRDTLLPKKLISVAGTFSRVCVVVGNFSFGEWGERESFEFQIVLLRVCCVKIHKRKIKSIFFLEIIKSVFFLLCIFFLKRDTKEIKL